MELEGRLQETHLAGLLRVVSALRRTGILTVQSQRDMLAVTFLHGRIVAADAMNETMEEGLGQVLEMQGLITGEAFADLVADQQSSGGRIADLLLDRQLIGREQLLEAIRLQTYRLLMALLRWREGEYNLFIDEEISFEDGIKPISVEELLVRAAEDLGGDSPLTGVLPDLSGVFERCSDQQVRVLGRDGEEPVPEPGVVWLTPTEVDVLEGTDGSRPASVLIGVAGLDDYQVRYALHELLRARLIRPGPVQVREEVHVPSSGLTPPSSLLRSDVQEHVRAEPEEPRRGDDSPGPFEPPLPEPPSVERPAVRQPGHHEVGAVASLWLSRSLALALLVLLFSLPPLPDARNFLFFPFPWQQAQRSELEGGQRSALYSKVDRASKTYYLLYGRFPEELEILADLELLSRRDLYDPQGRWLSYQATELSYTLQPLKDGVPVPGAEATGDISKDFVLNPHSVEPSDDSRRRPLVLLD